MTGAAMYAETQAQDLDDLVSRCAPLVKRIAYHLITRLPPSVQADDLIQAGMIGLLEASRHYDARQGASFETYAGIRIRGAMLDEVRKNNWVPRTLNRKMRQISEAIHEVEIAKGRDARDVEVADRLGVSLDEYHRVLRDASGRTVFGFDDLAAGGESLSEGLGEVIAGPLQEVEQEEFKQVLASALAGLPQRERMVMSLYYYEELNLREIGSVLGVSESRVCQIHSQSLLRLKARMSEWREPDGPSEGKRTAAQRPPGTPANTTRLPKY